TPVTRRTAALLAQAANASFSPLPAGERGEKAHPPPEPESPGRSGPTQWLVLNSAEFRIAQATSSSPLVPSPDRASFSIASTSAVLGRRDSAARNSHSTWAAAGLSPCLATAACAAAWVASWT